MDASVLYFPFSHVSSWFGDLLDMEQPSFYGAAMVHHETGSEEQLAKDIENGRLLFAGQCNFVAAANKTKALPSVTLPEVCFAGRSNVGKSSLINALTSRRMLARTSQTPGRTRQLIFFNLSDRLQLVDLPGFGYASAPKSDIKAWTNLTQRYLAGRPSLKRVFLLIDSRRGIGKIDQEIMKFLDKTAVSWAVLMTKVDKQKVETLNKICEETETIIRKHVAAYPEILITSSVDGTGIELLRAHIARFSHSKEG